MSDQTLWIMADGWEHPGWQGEYYPEDLPSEWRLGYYANEFRAVLLPEAVWRAADDGQFQQWLEDVSAEFRFFCEAAEAADCVRLQRLLGAQLGDGDALLERLELTSMADLELPGLRATLERLVAANAPHSVLVISGNPPPVEALRQAQLLAELLGY